MTYNEAYNKIINAYFKDEIVPLDGNFCFCGTLCDNTSDWLGLFHNYPSHGYTGRDFDRMEEALFNGIRVTAKVDSVNVLSRRAGIYEDALFAGMCAALEVLKQIHEQRGEKIDETPAFTKRQLQPA